MRFRGKLLIFVVSVNALILFSGMNETSAQGFPKLTVSVEESDEPQEIALTLQILAMMTVLSLAPSILIMMTCFTRIIVVFHFLRQALGTQQMPPNQLLLGLAIFLTIFVMAPVWTQVNDNALQPYLANEINYK